MKGFMIRITFFSYFLLALYATFVALTNISFGDWITYLSTLEKLP